jgi:stringent starvation protein B
VLAIYARENGQGMELPPDIVAQGSASPAQSVESMSRSDDSPPDDEPPSGESPPRRGAHLRIVK